MSFNTILGVGLALTVLLTATSVDSGELEGKVKDTYTTTTITTENPDNSIITPLDAQLIRPFNYSSYNAYENSFTLEPGNGETTNLWIKNTSTDTLYAQITVGNLSPLEIPIKKGTQKTITLGGSTKTNVKVYIYSSTGHNIEMSISARQF